MIATVSAHTTAIEAHIVRGRLEAEGIPAYVAFEHHIWAKWSISLLLGGVRVQVPASQHAAATAVIAAIHAGEYLLEEDTDAASEAPPCPACGSTDAKAVQWPWKMALLLIFMYALPIPFSHQIQKCRSCSRIWLAREQRGYALSVSVLSVLFLSTLITVFLAILFEWCAKHCEPTYFVY